MYLLINSCHIGWATRETVYAFLTDPALFQQWMGATSEHAQSRGACRAVSDRRRSRRRSRGGGAADARGLHGAIAMAATVSGREAVAIIELTVVPAGTRVSLRHEGLPPSLFARHTSRGGATTSVYSPRAADRQTGVLGAALAA